MVLWILMALMTGAAVLTVLWPLSRLSVSQRRERGDVDFYRDQLAEIARDQERGLMSTAEAGAARAEAGRRLIGAVDLEPGIADVMGEPALRRRRAASAIALSVIPLIGLAVYGALGSPHLRVRSAVAAAAPSGAGPASLSVDTAIAKIEDHLAQAPDDRRGWELVAPIYLRLGRFDAAVRAYSAARRLGADGAEQWTGYGEALTGAGSGVVSTEARQAFEKALMLEPDSPKARYYLALAAEQDGDTSRARDGYAAIVASAPADAPYLPGVRARLSRLDPEAAPTPVSEDMRPDINAMVDGLDRRLIDTGGSADEWLRLVRSLKVLGRTDDARDRLGRAKLALAGNADDLGRLDALAHDLGLDRAGERP